MVLGFAVFLLGYTLFYWGLHHMPGQEQRYSFWSLLGFSVTTPSGKIVPGVLLPVINVPEGLPFQWQSGTSSQSTQSSGSTTQTQPTQTQQSSGSTSTKTQQSSGSTSQKSTGSVWNPSNYGKDITKALKQFLG